MFQHLPVVTEESVRAFGVAELAGLLEKMRSHNLAAGLDALCAELQRNNPWLGKAVRVGCSQAMDGAKEAIGADRLKAPQWDTIAANCAVAVVATLRLVDRALEARDLERRLGL